MEKKCSKCEQLLPLDRFGKNKAYKDGLQYYCKDCCNKIQERYKGESGRYNKSSIDRRKSWALKNRFGITMEEYLERLVSQNHKCAICGESETSHNKGVLRKLAVDHCHTTGEIRGLLCRKCNIGLGMFKDRVEVIEKAKNYLENSKKSSIFVEELANKNE